MSRDRAPRKASLRTLGGRILLVGLSSLAAFCLMEGVARTLFPAGPPVRIQQLDQALAGDQRRQFSDLIVSDPDLFWIFAPSVRLPEDAWPFFGRISNVQGLREDHPIPRRKPPGELRILFVGDSTTFGFLVGLEETIPELTEGLLEERFPSTPIECVNAGVPGWTLYQGWRFLETRAAALDPDLVVLQFGWNEAVSWDGRSDAEHDAILRASRPPRWLRWSRVAGLVFAYQARQPPEGEPRPRVTPPEFAELLERSRQAAEALGAELLVLVGTGTFNLDPRGDPTHRNAYQREMIRFGRRLSFGPRGAPGSVDTVPVLQDLFRRHDIEELFFDQVHTTGLANGHIARKLVQVLGPWIEERRDSSTRGERAGAPVRTADR